MDNSKVGFRTDSFDRFIRTEVWYHELLKNFPEGLSGFQFSHNGVFSFGIMYKEKADSILDELENSLHGKKGLFHQIDDDAQISVCIFSGGLGGTGLLYYQYSNTYISIYLYGTKEDIVETIWAKLEISFKALAVRREDIVQAKISYNTPRGVSTYTAAIQCPAWIEIAQNYPTEIREKIALTQNGLNYSRGKLLIWHGSPGTGKTYAIRSLIRAWKESHTPIDVIDADQFLEDGAYYYSLIEDLKKPGLFIFEDSAESLLESTRNVAETRISKLLNMTDGLLSQGRQDIFLVTFNEQVTKIDSAATRPGRCQSLIKFREFNENEAIAWLKERKQDPKKLIDQKSMLGGKEAWSLADLYNLLNGFPVVNTTDLTIGLG